MHGEMKKNVVAKIKRKVCFAFEEGKSSHRKSVALEFTSITQLPHVIEILYLAKSFCIEFSLKLHFLGSLESSFGNWSARMNLWVKSFNHHTSKAKKR